MKKFLISLLIISFLVFPGVVLGIEQPFEGGSIAKNSTLPISGTSPAERLVLIVQISLAFLGAITVLVLIYAGFLFAFSAGNAQTVDKAKKIVVWAILGMVIVLGSWGITTFFKSNFSTSNESSGGSGDEESSYVCQSEDYCAESSIVPTSKCTERDCLTGQGEVCCKK